MLYVVIVGLCEEGDDRWSELYFFEEIVGQTSVGWWRSGGMFVTVFFSY